MPKRKTGKTWAEIKQNPEAYRLIRKSIQKRLPGLKNAILKMAESERKHGLLPAEEVDNFVDLHDQDNTHRKGRPPVTLEEKIKLVIGWYKARAMGIGQYRYCVLRGISTRTLQRYIKELEDDGVTG